MKLPASGVVAIYARFSSSRQDERSIDDQVRRCRTYVEQQYRAQSVEVFTDYAVSGASLDRRGFECLMAAVDAGMVSAIITEDISRISRDFADAAQIFKRLQYTRVPLIGVADGIDTSAKHAKLTYTLKSLVADLYLDDLRDKTLRGMEGRALAGFATGSVPHGYRTMPFLDARKREIGKQIEIDADEAPIVVRIFTEYAAGRSMTWIARTLNREGVPSPRIGSRHRFAGWTLGTIRVMLRNERYIGVWRFKTMQWVKVPNSNKRLPRKRPADEVIVRERPDLRIIELQLWEAVQALIAKGHRGRGRTRPRSRYLLSGVLVCAQCEAPLTICGGASLKTSYYRCATNRTKGICTNSASLRTTQLLAAVTSEIRARVLPSASLKEAIETQNGRRGPVLTKKIEECERALAATESQIERLVEFIAAGGQRFEYVLEKMRTLELVARTQKAELEMLRGDRKKPLRKITLADVGDAFSLLASAPLDDIEAVRERLCRWLGRTPMRFDGETVSIAIVPAALAADVARGGAAAPSLPTGKTVAIRVSVTHAIPRPTARPALAA